MLKDIIVLLIFIFIFIFGITYIKAYIMLTKFELIIEDMFFLLMFYLPYISIKKIYKLVLKIFTKYLKKK